MISKVHMIINHTTLPYKLVTILLDIHLVIALLQMLSDGYLSVPVSMPGVCMSLSIFCNFD